MPLCIGVSEWLLLFANIAKFFGAFKVLGIPGHDAGTGFDSQFQDVARVELIINNVIGIHPKAILDVERLPASKRDEIKRRARGYASPKDFFVEKLVEGVSTIAAAFWPNPVIVRLSDFKSNEYRKLLGGDLYLRLHSLRIIRRFNKPCISRRLSQTMWM